jgi:DEAD/DEAH box helicase domain-containing protein
MEISRRTGSARALQSASNLGIACLEVYVVSLTSVMSQSIEVCLTRLTTDAALGSLIRTHGTLLPGQGLDQELPAAFPPWLTTLAFSQGIARLTGAQRQALDLLRQGQHVCLMAPTGAGRGVVRLLAMYQALAVAQRGHALYIFSSKPRALAQSSAFATWNAALAPEHHLSVAMYDGDTPGTERRAIKQALPHLVLTTPEMLHTGILAYHGGWRAFFQDLRYVVLTDVHLGVGAFGVHLAHLCRRLHRLAQHYGAQPQYLLTSAPLANMEEVAYTLTAQACTVVTGEARRSQAQSRLLLESQDDPVDLCRRLILHQQEAGIEPLVLAPGGLVPQVHALGVAQAFPHHAPVAAMRARTYQSLICLGLPDSLTWLHDVLAWLASGALPSLSLLVLRGQTPLERFILRYPAVYEAPWLQHLVLYPSNPHLARYHLHCAAAELGLAAGERYGGIHGVGEIIHRLADTQAITRHTTSGTWVAKERGPHRRASLRTYEPAVTVAHAHDGRFLGRWTPERAFRDAFEGAVYTDEHGTWRVERVMAERRRILVHPMQTDYVTRGRIRTTVTQQSIAAAVARDAWRITYGPCIYTETLAAYERLEPHTGVCHSVHILPPRQRQCTTQGVWLRAAETSEPGPYPVQEAWHTLVHAVLAGLPLLLVSDAHSLRGGVYQDTAGVAAVFSDTQTGGNGTCAFLYQAHERLLRVALQVLLNCDCTDSCWRCIARQRCDTCESESSVPRQAGIHLLQRLLGEAVPTFTSVAEGSIPQHAQMPRHLYLTLRTQKSAEDVGGWQHRHLLGLGVALTYDTREGQYNVYTAETVASLLASLREADLVIGFNTHDFDYQVLQPYSAAPLATLPTLAVLDAVQHTLGFRLSLGHLVRETLGIERPDDSLHTLQWYQEGDRERIVQQCRRDLELLRALVRHGASTGTVSYRDAAGIRTTIPVHWQRLQQYG